MIKKPTHIFTSAYIFAAHILAMIAAPPIIYIGTDYDDFSIFHLAVQEISATQPVNWFTCHHTFLQNPIAGTCLVLDIPDTNFIHAPLIEAVSNYTHQARLALYVFTSPEPWDVKPMFKGVEVRAFVPKLVRFDYLVAQLKLKMEIA